MALTICNIEKLEKILISKKNRFKLSLAQKKEIFQKVSNKNHIIIGAAGSIGSVFSKYSLISPILRNSRCGNDFNIRSFIFDS